MSDLIEQFDVWLKTSWDPDLTVAEWWSRLGLAGWAAPTLPVAAFGKGASRTDAEAVSARIAAHGALGPPAGMGMLMAAPTIAMHGTPEQVDELVRPIVTGQHSWCQLFSEPGAGSDLAGLGTRAERVGDEWIVNGQKVWTSGGETADMGMLLARTDPEAPKHRGITWFAFAMHQPGAVDVRPLRDMTGRASFNELFLTDGRVPDTCVIGGANNGWAVANTTLGVERQGQSAGSQSHAALAMPGTVVGDLDRRAGDVVSRTGPGSGGEGAMVAESYPVLLELARENGTIAEPTVRQQLLKLYTLNEVARFTNMRAEAEQLMGRGIPGVGNLGKLSMSDIARTSRDLGLAILGAAGMLHTYTEDGRTAIDAATENPLASLVTAMALFAQAPSIYGGTDQVQRNIVGERVLGLPKEPSDDRTTPWSALLRNG